MLKLLFTSGMPFLSVNQQRQGTKRSMDISLLQVTGCPVCRQPTVLIKQLNSQQKHGMIKSA